MAACQNGGYPDSDWLELRSTFRVTFHSHPDTDYSDADVPTNVPVNVRQQWFLNQLKAGENIKSTDLSSNWKVVEKMAKRDIAYLTK
jgi:hypothetical protein